MNYDEPGRQRLHLNSEEHDAVPASYSELSENQPARKLQLLDLGSLQLGVFEDEIATIAEWRQPTPLPHAPPAVLGVVSIQGRMLTVLDPLRLLDETTNNTGSSWGFIVALRGDEQLALAIKKKTDASKLTAKDIDRPPETARLVLGVVHLAGQAISVLDVKQLFSAAIRGHERRRRRF